jgi:predicted phage-related endonuclease
MTDLTIEPVVDVEDRSHFIGGSDARIIMGGDETALIRLWQQKRGEASPPDLSDNLAVQLGRVTEGLNRFWYERMSGQRVGHCQSRRFHPSIVWMAATLDGLIEQTGAVFESKFMLPWSFSEQAAAEKHMAQLQHNMMVVGTKAAVLSIITGGGKWVEIAIAADPVYQMAMMYAERAFWRAVASGEPPQLFHAEPPRARIEAVRAVDMTNSNAWAEQASLFCRTRQAFLDHERAKAELKLIMPEDAKEACGHGVRGRRSKAGAVSFDLLEAADATV